MVDEKQALNKKLMKLSFTNVISVSVYEVTCLFWTSNHHFCCHVIRNLSPLTFKEPKNRFRQARNLFLGSGVAAASVDCVADDNDPKNRFRQARNRYLGSGVAAASVDCVADDNDQ